MELENAMNMLVDVVVKEYTETKKELTEERKLNVSLADQNHSLYVTAEKYGEERERLRQLLAPAITWANGEPLYLSQFNTSAMKEICKILKIEEHPKAML